MINPAPNLRYAECCENCERVDFEPPDFTLPICTYHTDYNEDDIEAEQYVERQVCDDFKMRADPDAPTALGLVRLQHNDLNQRSEHGSRTD